MEIEVMEKCFEKIISELKRNHIKEINTDIDYFYNIDIGDAVIFNEGNPNNCIESFKDDYKELTDLAGNNRPANILDLERLANVMRILSYEIEKNPKYVAFSLDTSKI